MKLLINLRNVALIVGVVFLMNCKGETGAVGPKGDKGDTGAAGKNGENGATGTANVIYSEWFSPAEAEWNKVSSVFYKFTKDEPKITTEMMNTAAIFMYARQNQQTINLMPFTKTTDTSISTYNVEVSVGKISVVFLEMIETAAKPSSGMSFRYVIIPGGVKSRINSNFNDYRLIEKELNLKN